MHLNVDSKREKEYLRLVINETMKIGIFKYGLLLLTLIACDSDIISPNRLLVKEIENPISYKDYFTYQDGLLINYQRFFGELEETKIKFYYSDRKLIKLEKIREHGVENYFELTYNDKGQRHQEILTTVYNGEVTYVRTSTFSYVNDELASVKLSYDKPDYTLQEREFHWSKGNLVRIDFFYYDNNTRYPTISRLYNYDNKVNYANQDIAFVYILGDGDETQISRSNLVSMNEISGTTVYEGGQHSFTYNINGYPIESVYKAGGQEFTPIQIRYY